MGTDADKNQSFWTTIPGLLTGLAALITAIVGCYQSGLLSSLVPVSPSPTFTSVPPTATQTPPPVQVVTVVITLAPDDPSTTVTLSAPEAQSGCPYYQGMEWLQYRDTWYQGSWGGYLVQYDVSYFYVYDPNIGYASQGIYYSSRTPHYEMIRDTWYQLLNTPFWACIDVPGNVYVLYVP